MARKMVVTATGKSYTATTTPATVQIPFNSADMWPSLLTISATAPVHIRLGDPSVTAATTDLMVQPADHVTIRTNGAGYISYRSASGTCNVQISPTEDGPMNYRGQIPDYIQGILAPYGSNAHVYLPGASGATVAGFQTGNYTSNDGSTGLSAIDGTAGLVLDAAGAVGAEAFVSPNVGATWTNQGGGSYLCNSNAWGNMGMNIASGAVPGVIGGNQKFLVTCTLSGAFTSMGLYSAIDGSGSNNALIKSFSAAGTYTFFADTAAYGGLWFDSNTGSGCVVSAVSFKKYTGIHASQSTAGNRPAERRGLYNLLTYSNDLSNAAWNKTRVTLSSGATYNGNASQLVTWDGTLTNGYCFESYNFVSGTPYTLAAIWKPGTANTIIVNSFTQSGNASFTLTGSGSAGGPSGIATAASIVPLSDGFYLLALNLTASATASNNLTGGIVAGTAHHFATGLFAGTLTAAQILAEGGIPLTTSSAASNSAAGRYSWAFNGTSSSLLTGNLGITNAVSITVSGRIDSLAATNVLFGEDTGGLQLYVQSNGTITFDKNGTAPLAGTSAGEIVAGVPFVITARLSGGTAVIRKNGVQKVSSATALVGAATTGARIGAQFGGTLPYNGSISAVDVVVGAVSDADCLTIERNAAMNSPAGPVF